MNGFIVSLFALVAVASAGLLPNEPVPILSQDSEVNYDGSFRNSYETGNGISYSEQGYHQPGQGQQEGTNVVQGSASWTAPDGTPVSITWTADANGAVFGGSHLPVAPTPPPIPEAILRSLEWNAAHPEENDGQVPQLRQAGQARPLNRRF